MLASGAASRECYHQTIEGESKRQPSQRGEAATMGAKRKGSGPTKKVQVELTFDLPDSPTSLEELERLIRQQAVQQLALRRRELQAHHSTSDTSELIRESDAREANPGS